MIRQSGDLLDIASAICSRPNRARELAVPYLAFFACPSIWKNQEVTTEDSSQPSNCAIGPAEICSYANTFLRDLEPNM